VWEEASTLLNQLFGNMTLQTLCQRGQDLGIKKEMDPKIMYYI
jgi:hypothetical protein